jgi:hypothetical protein
MNSYEVKEISFEHYLYHLGIAHAKAKKKKHSTNKDYQKGYRIGLFKNEASI